MTVPELSVEATEPTSQSSVSAAATEPTNQSSVSVKPARKRGMMIRKSNLPSPQQLPKAATKPTNESSVSGAEATEPTNQSSSSAKPARKHRMVQKSNDPSPNDRNRRHQETPRSDELRSLKFRAIRRKMRSDDKVYGNDDDDDEIEETSTYSRPGALFIASSPANNEGVEEHAGETPPPANQDVEDPKPHEVEARLVEEGEIVHGEVVHYSRAKVACLLSLLVGIALVVVLATVLTRDKQGREVLLVLSSTPTLQPSMQPTQSASGRLHDLLLPISGDKLMNSSSPQYKAFFWLTSEDPSLVAHDEDTQDWVLTERYVIALLYFEWFTPEVSRNYKFMSNLSVCEWKFEDLGIYCFETGRDIGRVAQVNIRE